MRSHLASMLCQIPSVQEFLGAIADDLGCRRSVLALLPMGVEVADVWPALSAMLSQRSFAVEPIAVPELPPDLAPSAAAARALGLQWPEASAPRTAANLLQLGGLPDIVALYGLEEIAQLRRQEWLAWIGEWTRASRNVADQGKDPPALLLVVPAVAVLPRVPDPETHLAIHWWWGFPSVLECQLLSRLIARVEGLALDGTWREHVLPAVAGSDVALLEYLWGDVGGDREHLVERLLSLAAARGLEESKLRDLGIDELVPPLRSDPASVPASPPVRWRMLWAQGAIGCTPEHGPEAHAAALAVLGRTEELSHRIWSGQAQLILPLLDSWRLALCNQLTRTYGRDWPVRWHTPEIPEEEGEVRASPLACSWGYLEWLLRNCGQLCREQRYVPIVSMARRARNELAHYRPLRFAAFNQLWQEAQSRLAGQM